MRAALLLLATLEMAVAAPPDGAAEDVRVTL